MPFWKSLDFWSVGGFFIGLVGFIAAVVFYFNGKSRKVLEYQISRYFLIFGEEVNIPGIKILYDDKPIQDLISTTIRFINTGNQTIDSNDFAKQAPLCVTCSGQFYGFQRGYQIVADNPSSFPTINMLNEQSIKINFDFLKPQQKLRITFLHSGDLSVQGELKNGKIVDTTPVEPWKKKKPDIVSNIFWTLVGVYFGLLLFSTGVVVGNSDIRNDIPFIIDLSPAIFSSFIPVIITCIIVLLCRFLFKILKSLRKRYMKKLKH